MTLATTTNQLVIHFASTYAATTHFVSCFNIAIQPPLICTYLAKIVNDEKKVRRILNAWLSMFNVCKNNITLTCMSSESIYLYEIWNRGLLTRLYIFFEQFLNVCLLCIAKSDRQNETQCRYAAQLLHVFIVGEFIGILFRIFFAHTRAMRREKRANDIYFRQS